MNSLILRNLTTDQIEGIKIFINMNEWNNISIEEQQDIDSDNIAGSSVASTGPQDAEQEREI